MHTLFNTGVFAAQDMSMTALVPRLFLSMAVVIGVMWLAARIMRNRQIPGHGVVQNKTNAKKMPAIQVISKQGLAKGASIAVIRTGKRQLVLGVTEHNISVLTELDDRDLITDTSRQDSLGVQRTDAPSATALDATASSARKGLLEQVREMTVRK